MSDVEEGAVSEEEEEEVEEETPRSQDGEEEEPEKPGSSVSRTSRATKSAVSNKLSRYALGQLKIFRATCLTQDSHQNGQEQVWYKF